MESGDGGSITTTDSELLTSSFTFGANCVKFNFFFPHTRAGNHSVSTLLPPPPISPQVSPWGERRWARRSAILHTSLPAALQLHSWQGVRPVPPVHPLLPPTPFLWGFKSQTVHIRPEPCVCVYVRVCEGVAGFKSGGPPPLYPALPAGHLQRKVPSP